MRFPGRAFFASFLLLLFTAVMAADAAPVAAAHCECTHGPELPCSCPHHAAGGQALPACHLKLLKAKAAAAKAHPTVTPLPCGKTARRTFTVLEASVLPAPVEAAVERAPLPAPQLIRLALPLERPSTVPRFPPRSDD